MESRLQLVEAVLKLDNHQQLKLLIMGFINALAKGFIRSAVNQVGRDGGKVVSNKVYGNRHSTPIRNTNGINVSLSSPPTDDLNTIDEEFKPVYFDSNFISYFLMLVGSLILPFIGPLYWILVASRNLFKTNMRYFTIIQEPVYVSDKRYKTGVRQAGVKPVKHYSDSTTPLTGNERFFFIAKGIIALLLGALLLYIQYQIYQAIRADFQE